MIAEASLVTIAIFLAGVIFHAGRLSGRVGALEGWRKEAREDVAYIREQLAGMAIAAHGQKG